MGKGVAPGEGGSSFKIVPIFRNEAKKYLTKDYLQRLEDCIRQRTPIAGTGINIKAVEGSYNISLNIPLTPIELTVCSNGQPATIKVLAYNE